MNVVRVALRELVGLFVEDVGYAVAILAWVGLCAFAFASLAPAQRGVVLFLGLAVILLGEVVRSAARR